MKTITLVILILTLSSSVYCNYPDSLSITSMNIRFYGLGGEASGSYQDEFRDNWLMEHFINKKILSDVMVFQEIVNKSRLQNLFKNDYSCISYDSIQKFHQYVVLCYKKNLYYFDKAKNDVDYVINSSSLEKYRPAVYGVLKTKEMIPIINIIGVHLKAKEGYHETRLEQVKLISEEITAINETTPSIIIGDFNLLSETEVIGVSEVLSSLNLKHIPNDKFTYIGFGHQNILDHAWITQEIDANLEVISPLAVDQTSSKRFDNQSFYNRFISDHAAIKVTLSNIMK